MDRAKVASWTTSAKVTLVAALVLGAGVGVAGFPGASLPKAPEPVATVTPSTPTTATATPAAAPSVEVPDIAARLGQLGNHPKPIEVAVTPTETTPTPTASTEEIKYLGPIGIGQRKLALLVVSGKQVILGAGDTLPPKHEHKIAEVTDLEVQIDEGGKEPKKIERANKSAVAVTTIVNPAAAPATPKAAGPSDQPMNDNMRDRIRQARDRRAALRGPRQAPGQQQNEANEQNPGDAPR
ncbi:MAG: hypothetical protein SFY96_03980 [Planctomycetota bacterium]|nr:hypothetical protein [Planctomycetota bacterium]